MDERIVPSVTAVAQNVSTSVHVGNPATLETSVTVTRTDSNDPTDPFTISSVSTPSNGTVTITENSVTLMPNAGFVGTSILYYTMGDGHANSATGMMTFEFTNTPPTAANYDVYVHAGTVATVTPTLSDPDNDSVSITSVSNSENGNVTLNNGVITFTPNANFIGDANINYTVSDGNSNGTVTGTITVHVLNQPPVPLNYAFTAHAGNMVVIMPDMLVDPDGDYTFISGVGMTANGTISVDSQGEIYFTPTPGYTGTVTFDYTLSDIIGATGTGYISLTFTNTAPTASDGSYSTTNDVSITNNVISGVSDADGDTLTASHYLDPIHGTLTLNSDGSFVYVPTVGYVGTDTFQVDVSDGNGGDVIKTVTVEVDAAIPPKDTRTEGKKYDDLVTQWTAMLNEYAETFETISGIQAEVLRLDDQIGQATTNLTFAQIAGNQESVNLYTSQLANLNGQRQVLSAQVTAGITNLQDKSDAIDAQQELADAQWENLSLTEQEAREKENTTISNQPTQAAIDARAAFLK